MLRAVLYLLIALLLVTFLRAVIGIIGKAFGDLLKPPETSKTEGMRMGGELKRDPVCGTYVSTATSVKKTVDGEVIHFCSEACRDKYPVKRA